MGYLLDTSTLAEVLRAVPSRMLIRRLTNVPSRDRWTSAVNVGQLLFLARQNKTQKVMQDVIRLVAAVKVAPFDVVAAQTFAKFRATIAPEAEPDDVMIAAIAVANDFTLVTRRLADFRPFPHLRVEDWI